MTTQRVLNPTEFPQGIIGIEGGAQLSDIAPTDVGNITAVPGVGTDASRHDHTHHVSIGPPAALAFGGAASTGTAMSISASDHMHELPVPPIVSPDAAGYVPAMDGIVGRVLTDINEAAPVWRQLTFDDLAPAFTVALSGGGVLEIGNSVTNPAFTASYTNGPPLTSVLTDSEGNAAVNLTTPFTAVTSPHPFLKTGNNNSVTFTITAAKTGGDKVSTAAYVWKPRVYWGVGIAAQSSEVFVKALASSALMSARAQSFSVSPGALEKIYYAYPDSYGAATFTVGGFSGGFIDRGVVSITNTFGVTQNYRLYESTNLNLGNTTVIVS